MTIFAALQNTYQTIEIALCRATSIIATTTISKACASKDIVSALDTLLKDHSLTLQDLKFLAVNQGPGPFTTLRVVIACVNGISFATGIPLIGVDGLAAFLTEYRDTAFFPTVALLNAFNNDTYFSLDDGTMVQTGCMNIQSLLLMIKEKYPAQPVRCIGLGVELYNEEILNTLGQYADIPHPLPKQSSLAHIALIGYERWQKKATSTHQLLPLYLKQWKPTPSIKS